MFQRRFFLFYAFNCTVISLQPSRFGPDVALIYFHAKPTETPRGGDFKLNLPRTAVKFYFLHILKIMKVSCIICSIILIASGIFATVYALFSYNLLLFLCFYNRVAYRIALSSIGVASGWLLFWLLAFRPQDNLN